LAAGTASKIVVCPYGYIVQRLGVPRDIKLLNYEAEAPCERVRGREQAKKYMKNNRAFGIVIDIPIERYHTEYPKPYRDRVG
jgi:hypothetical protein